MPKKNVKRKDKPQLFARVFKIVNGLKDKRCFITIHRIAKEIHAKLEQMGLQPDSRNVLIQVRRALKFGVQKKLFLYKGGKYRIAIAESTSKIRKKVVVPLDSLELINSCKSRRKSTKVKAKKRRCTRPGHTSACRKPYKKREPRQNKRHLSRKCKSGYSIESTSNKSSKVCSKSGEGTQLSGSTGKVTNTKTESCEFQGATTPPTTSDIHHWDNKQEAIDKSKYGKQSRKSRMRLSNRGSISTSEGPKSRKNKKRKLKNLKEIENLSSSTDDSSHGLSTSTAIAAAIMIMMSLWYGYR